MIWNSNMDEASRDGKQTITVETKYSPDGLIEQSTFQTGLMSEVMRKVVDTRDEHIRKALIDLGWTPPPEVK